MIALTALNARPPAPAAYDDLARRLDQIRVLCAHARIPAGAARVGIAVLLRAGVDGLLMVSTAELAALAGCELRAVAGHLRALADERILIVDMPKRMHIAIRVTIAGRMLTDELDSHARRLREVRRTACAARQVAQRSAG